MIIKQIKFVKYAHLLVLLVKMVKIHALNVSIHRIEYYLDLHVCVYQNTTIQEVMFVRSALNIAWNVKTFQLNAHNVIQI